MKRTYQENKSLYEAIMRDVAKIVKGHLLNENRLNSNLSDSDIFHKLDEELTILPPKPQQDIYKYDATGIEVVKKALIYIENNKEMLKLFLNSKIIAIQKSNEMYVCGSKYGSDIIIINPEFIKDNELNEKQVAYLILNTCVHLILKHKYDTVENSIFREKFVNRYLEKKFPDFRGMTKELNGFI